MPIRRPPWLMRTYSGHTSARASNALYRENLARGQTGLSVAFDLPTQTGYDPDHPLARGEVGRVGVPVAHLGDLEVLFEGLPLGEMNTSMTINATAPWLCALYVALADSQGVPRRALQGTTQNDLVKEFLARGTYMLPPEPSLRLQTDLIAFAVAEIPRWNPINVCSYHLQEAGATPVLEVSVALANAVAVLDALRARPHLPASLFPEAVGRMSFFLNAGIRFVEELTKVRVMARLWERTVRDRYGISDPKLARFRYGVQVNSLGLTEQQPENNVYRVALELLGVVLSDRARARAVQLPCWNEALGLPRPWDQQWSLRLQQILAYETDLLEHEDLFDGSRTLERLEGALEAEVTAELAWIEEQGGLGAAVADGALKRRLVEAHQARLDRIATGEQTVVGVNRFTESAPSGLAGAGVERFVKVDPAAAEAAVAGLARWRRARSAPAVMRALDALDGALDRGENLMPASIACAQAGVSTGEWSQVLRDRYGDYRAPTGVAGVVGRPLALGAGDALALARQAVEEVSARLGRRLKLLIAKPGLDGHSNGAEQVAVRARDAGMEVVYQGIRLTPAQIAAAAEEEGVHAVGLSILSGSHLELVPAVIEALAERGLARLPVVVGGIIPPPDREILLAHGVARIYSPSDYDLDRVMGDLARVVGERAP